MTLGQKIRYIRKKAGLTQKEAAEKFYVIPQTFSRYEKDQREPDYGFIKSFCDYFEVSADWLITDKGKIYRKDSKVADNILEIFSAFLASLDNIDNGFDEQAMNLNLDIEKLKEPKNFICMIKYMMSDLDVMVNMFQFFYLFQKPQADKKRNSDNK
jgi:transcriptional regulator with XRE-family HTH domain